MEFSEVVRRRRMVRRFLPDPLPDPLVDRVVDAALRGPSAGFSQGTELLVLRHRADVERYWAAATPASASGAGAASASWLDRMRVAPVLLVLWSDPQRYLERYAAPDKSAAAAAIGRPGPDPAAWPVPWWDVDTGMAALLALLAAVDAEVGACLFGVPAGREDAVREAFGVPGHLRPLGVVALGRPAPEIDAIGAATTGPSPGRPPRRPREEVVHESRYRVSSNGPSQTTA